jgi:hypothetical protein
MEIQSVSYKNVRRAKNCTDGPLAQKRYDTGHFGLALPEMGNHHCWSLSRGHRLFYQAGGGQAFGRDIRTTDQKVSLGPCCLSL